VPSITPTLTPDATWTLAPIIFAPSVNTIFATPPTNTSPSNDGTDNSLRNALLGLGLLNAGTSVVVSASAQKRKEELDAQATKEKTTLDADKVALVAQATANFDANTAQVRAGKKLVTVPPKQSEANKRFMAELAYRRQMQNRLIGQWLVGMHAHNEHKKALEELERLKQQRQYVVQNTSRVNQVENRQLGLLGEINDGFLDENVVKRGGKHIPRALNDQLPSAIRRVWGGDLPDLDVQIMNLEDRIQTYEALRDTRNQLASYGEQIPTQTTIKRLASDNKEIIQAQADSYRSYASVNGQSTSQDTSSHKVALDEAFINVLNGDSNISEYQQSIYNAFQVSFSVTNGLYNGEEKQGNDWTVLNVHFVRVGVEKTADAFGIWANEIAEFENDVDSFELYRNIMGEMTFVNHYEPKNNFAQSERRVITVFKRPSIGTKQYYIWIDDGVEVVQPVEYADGTPSQLPDFFSDNITPFDTDIVRIEERDDGNGRQAILTPNTVIHELAHSFNSFAGFGDANLDGKQLGGNINNPTTIDSDIHPNTRLGMGYPDAANLLNSNLYWINEGEKDEFGNWIDGIPRLVDPFPTDYQNEQAIPGISFYNNRVDILRQSKEETLNEITADAFLNWVLDLTTENWKLSDVDPEITNYQYQGFTHDEAGMEWRDYMNDYMAQWVRNAIYYTLPEQEQIQFYQDSILQSDEINFIELDPIDGFRVRAYPPEPSVRITGTDGNISFDFFGISTDENWVYGVRNGRTIAVGIDAFSGMDLSELKQYDADNAEHEEELSRLFQPNMPIEETDWWTDLLPLNNDVSSSHNADTI